MQNLNEFYEEYLTGEPLTEETVKHYMLLFTKQILDEIQNLEDTNKLLGITEMLFISHCDNQECDLGSIQFDCPNCGKLNFNYDNWFDQDDIIMGDFEGDIICEHCKEKLTTCFDEVNGGVYLK